jgi:hypothetical protein
MKRNILPLILMTALLQLSCNRDRQESDSTAAPGRRQTTYCNPIDIDYTYMSHYRAERDVSYRTRFVEG